MREFLTLVIVAALLILASLVGLTTGAAEGLMGDELVAIGLMVLLAFAAGEVVRRVGLPALLGYIGAGVLLGPSFSELVPGSYPFAIITEEVIQDLAVMQILVVGLIGMLAGAKLRLSELGGQARLVARVTLTIAAAVIPATIAAALITPQIFPEALSFIAAQPPGVQLTIALFFGVLAFGLSPTITVALIQELRSRGPLSTAALSVVVVGEFLLFGIFAMLLAGAKLVAGPAPVTTAEFLGMLPALGAELVLSLGLGLGLGTAIAAYARFVRRELLLFVLVAIIGAYMGSLELSAEPTLVFLVAGFFVQKDRKSTRL